MHPYFHCNIIDNIQNVEASQVTIDQRVDKKVVHLYNEILLDHKNEWTLTICNSMNAPGGYYAKWKKSVRKRQMRYDLTNIRNLKNK